MSERPVKKIWLRYQSPPVASEKQHVFTKTKKGKKLLFSDDIIEHPSDKVSKKKGVAAMGGDNLLAKDITDHEWALQYVNSNKKVVLLIARAQGEGQLVSDCPFSYGRVLRLDYEDPNSLNLILLVECSKGVRKMYVSEDQLVKDSSGPESFKVAIETSNNLITTLRLYIQGHVTLREPSPSLVKVAPRKVANQSRHVKKKVTKMSEFESSSSTNDEEMRATLGVELVSSVLSSKQNKIQREIMQKKLVRKGSIFNLPIIHIHKPPFNAKTRRRTLEIKEPHKLHV